MKRPKLKDYNQGKLTWIGGYSQDQDKYIDYIGSAFILEKINLKEIIEALEKRIKELEEQREEHVRY